MTTTRKKHRTFVIFLKRQPWCADAKYYKKERKDNFCKLSFIFKTKERIVMQCTNEDRERSRQWLLQVVVVFGGRDAFVTNADDDRRGSGVCVLHFFGRRLHWHKVLTWGSRGQFGAFSSCFFGWGRDAFVVPTMPMTVRRGNSVCVFCFFWQEILLTWRANKREKRAIWCLCKLFFWRWGRVVLMHWCQLCQWQKE